MSYIVIGPLTLFRLIFPCTTRRSHTLMKRMTVPVSSIPRRSAYASGLGLGTYSSGALGIQWSVRKT
jgi:hypothetical protein